MLRMMRIIASINSKFFNLITVFILDKKYRIRVLLYQGIVSENTLLGRKSYLGVLARNIGVACSLLYAVNVRDINLSGKQD